MSSKDELGPATGGLAAWLLEKLRGRHRPQPRLALLERITLAPRQSLALVEAEGRKILVATSPDGGPAFYPLDDRGPSAAHRAIKRPAPVETRIQTRTQARIQTRTQARVKTRTSARASW